MNCQDAEIDNSSTPSGKGKVLGVIVLTDNRQVRPPDKYDQAKYHGSAFKETEVDPLQFVSENVHSSLEENSLVELSRRVMLLEQRVAALSRSEAWVGGDGVVVGVGLRKKNRRKFKQLVRDHKVLFILIQCPICSKMYGSDTSLKYHLKLKHAESIGHSQLQ